MIGRATTVLLLGVWSVCAAAPAPVLRPDSESGFRRLMQMAQTGALGSDVVNANVGIDGVAVTVELVRATPPDQSFVLTFKTSGDGASRWFDVAGREGTTPADVARLGSALDRAFDSSPFQSLSGDDRPGPREGRHPVSAPPSMASKPYTLAVTLALAVALAGGLVLLWRYTPPDPSERSGGLPSAPTPRRRADGPVGRAVDAIMGRVTLVVGGMVVGLVICECIARAFAPFVLVNGRLSLLGERYDRRAPMTLTEIDGVPMWFHEQSDRPTPKPKKEGFRIVVLGDSVLMPAVIPEREGAIRLLENLLGTTLDGGPYEVVNLAEGGWSTLQEEVRLRHEGPALHPDLVVVGLSPNDDMQYVMVDGQLIFTHFIQDAEERGDHVLARHSYAWNWLWIAEKSREATRGPLVSQPEHDSVLASLTRMAEMTRAAGSRFAILCLPILDEEHVPSPACVWPDVVAWAERAGVPLLGAASLYGAYPLPLVRLDTIHLSALGHRVLAVGWLRWLLDAHLVPGRAVHDLPDYPPIPAPADGR
jgi:hypothetical protein